MRTRPSTISAWRRRRWITSISTTTQAIPACRSRTTTWWCGTCRWPRRRASSRTRAMLTRRDFLGAGGLALSGLVGSRAVAAGVVEIHMMSDTLGTKVWFDPVGIRIQPGRTVRWIVHSNVHSTTAYHPRNDHHSLRIPERAEPWDSRFLVNPGSHFEVTLTVEGVYDYWLYRLSCG